MPKQCKCMNTRKLFIFIPTLGTLCDIFCFYEACVRVRVRVRVTLQLTVSQSVSQYVLVSSPSWDL
jgi:hypothetical protein